MDRFEDLVSEYLDGTLDTAGRAELASMVDADPARRDAFVAYVREHQLLSAELGTSSEDAFARRVMGELNKDRTQFVRAVMADLKKPGGSKPAPRSRPPVRPRRDGPSGWVLWVSLAAGLLVILAILLSLGGEDEAAKRSRPVAVEKPRPVKPTPIPAPPPETSKEGVSPPAPKPEDPEPPKPTRPTPLPPAPKTVPEPVTLPAPKPVEAIPEKPALTTTEVAKLESIEGDVTLGDAAAQPGPLTPGFVLETKGEKGTAVIRYPDGTRVDLGGSTKVQDDSTKPGRVLMVSGVVSAEVAKQPADKPMLFLTAHAEARVLGTRLRVETIGDSTRLDVTEGRVRLTRLKDKAFVEVVAGHGAVAGPSGPMTSRLTRASAGLVALYTLKEGKGAIAHDTSRVGAPLDLRIETEGAVKWSSKGLVIGAPGLVASPGPATKIAKACRASNELTIEAWVRPGILAPANKDGRIVALSGDYLNQDFVLGQDELKGPVRAWFTRLRTTATDLVGKPALAAPDNTVTPKLTHLVYTRGAAGLATLYVDGVEVARATATGTLTNWNEGYRLGFGNEFGTDRPWLGEIHLVAIYSRALGAEDVKQNLKAGAE